MINELEKYMLPCLNKKLLGFECMGCGLQRSGFLLFNGEFIAAFKMYPAIYTITPMLFIILISLFYKFKYSSKIINGLAIASISIIIISFIIKQIN